MEPISPPAPVPPAIFATGLALLAVAWGGATEGAGQIAVLAGIGLGLFLFPVRRKPDLAFTWAALALIFVTLVAWLPADRFSSEAWRPHVEALGIILPSTLTPQPALSLDGVILLVAGLAWVAWLTARPWDGGARTLAAGGFVLGLTLTAAIALAAWAFHHPIPWWHPHFGFGPFPNRNHSGHVFAIGGLLALGCIAESSREGWRRMWPWALCTVVLSVALVATHSRGGVLLLFGGAGLWCLGSAWKRRSPKLLVLGLSGLLVAGSLVLICGGAFADRVVGGADSEVAFRPLIWRDTLALIAGSPWCGVGLENFHALFPFYRSASVIQQGVLHPESDWLWLAAEAGWGAVLLALAALVALLRGAIPFARGTQRRLRGAACAAAVAAALHGAIDVPEHRLGSALAALLALALARCDPLRFEENRLLAFFSRMLGLVLIGIAVSWGLRTDELAHASALASAGRFPEAEAAATRGLARAPLDWTGYFIRAGAEADHGSILAAVADFRRARLLEPHYAQVPLEEGRLWAELGLPELALEAWGDALHRVPPGDDSSLFSTILGEAPNNPAFRARLLELAADRPLLALQWFRLVPPAEAAAHADQLAPLAESAVPKERELFYKRLKEVRPVAQ